MVIPSVVLVEDDGSTKTSCWVDSSSSDGDGCQVDQEHSESNRERCKNLSNFKKKKTTKHPDPNTTQHQSCLFDFLFFYIN